MPIPLALALAPSLIGTGVGLAQQGRLRKDLAGRQEEAEAQFDRSLQAIRDISFEPSQELRDARMSQLEAGRAIADLAAQRTDEAQARAIAALRDSPRDLQSVGTRVIDSALDAQQDADIAGTQQTLGAELGMAEDAEAARMRGIQRDLSLEQMLMGRAAQAGDVAQSGIFASQAATTEAIQGLGNLGTQALLQGVNFNKIRAGKDSTDTTGIGLTGFGTVAAGFGTGAASGIGMMGTQLNFDGTVNFDGNPATGNGLEKGGYIGEEGGVTEGEFNHDTNKKAIIDEENGRKEGELTGGEMVLNPEQTDGITTLVEKGDAEGLLMFLRDLLSQPQFQEA